MSDLKEPVPRPNKRFGVRHLQYVLMFVTVFMLCGQRATLSVAIVAMTDETSADEDVPTYPKWDHTDAILSSFFWGYVVLQPGAGQLGEFFGPKRFLFGAIIISSIFNALIPIMAQLLGQKGVIICRVAQGFSQGFLYPSIHGLLSRWTCLQERTQVFGFVYSAASLGTVIAMVFAGGVADSKLGWPWVFYFSSIVGLIWGVIYGIFGASSPRLHKSISIEEREYIDSTNFISKSKKKVPTPWKAIFTSLRVWAIFINFCALTWGLFTLQTEIPTFLSNVMRFDIKSNSLLSALPYVLKFLMNYVAGFSGEKLLSNKIFSIGVTRKIFNSIGNFIPAIALFTLGFVNSSQKNLAVVLLVVGVGVSSFSNVGSEVNIIDLAPNHAGTIMGLTMGTSQIFSILGPLTVGLLGSDKTDMMLWRKVFWLAAGLYVVCGLFYVAFASGEVQKWNDPLEKNKKKVELN